MSRLVVRELRSPAEFKETTEISKEAWGFADREVSPASDLIAATHAGGLTAGAFLGTRLLGFVHGIPRVNKGEPCQHSHLLAVRPEAQGKGLSAKLKWFQRRWCLDHGIRLATWTYDPFLVKNAKLNLGRLRGRVSTLLPDFYGSMGGIYDQLPTDRFEVTWRLDDPIVERAARGEDVPAFPADAPPPPVVRGSRVPAEARVLLPFLAGAPSIYRSDPAASRRARREFARRVSTLFRKGFEATGVVVRAEGPAYLLARR